RRGDGHLQRGLRAVSKRAVGAEPYLVVERAVCRREVLPTPLEDADGLAVGAPGALQLLDEAGLRGAALLDDQRPERRRVRVREVVLDPVGAGPRGDHADVRAAVGALARDGDVRPGALPVDCEAPDDALTGRDSALLVELLLPRTGREHALQRAVAPLAEALGAEHPLRVILGVR